MLGRPPAVELANLNAWWRSHLGFEINNVMFSEGHLATVLGVELTSTQQVVVKFRAPAPRLRGRAPVHRRAFERGLPCPEPLVDLAPMGRLVGSPETMVTDGAIFPSSLRAVDRAKAPGIVSTACTKDDRDPSLAPHPLWAGPDLESTELWPVPDDRSVDLNAAAGPNGSTKRRRSRRTD